MTEDQKKVQKIEKIICSTVKEAINNILRVANLRDKLVEKRKYFFLNADYICYERYTGLNMIKWITGDYYYHVNIITNMIEYKCNSYEYDTISKYNDGITRPNDFEIDVSNLCQALRILSYYKNLDKNLEIYCLVIQRAWRHLQAKPGSKLYKLAKNGSSFF